MNSPFAPLVAQNKQWSRVFPHKLSFLEPTEVKLKIIYNTNGTVLAHILPVYVEDKMPKKNLKRKFDNVSIDYIDLTE